MKRKSIVALFVLILGGLYLTGLSFAEEKKQEEYRRVKMEPL